MGVGTLVLFLILEEMISVFHCWEYFLWVCYIWPLLCWVMFFLWLHSGEFFIKKRMLNFVRLFLCMYYDDHMIFIFQFVNMVYRIDWFAYFEESLHSWDKSHLTMVYDPCNCAIGFCLLQFCWGFLHLCSSVVLACNFLSFCGIFDFGITLIVAL